MTVGVVSQSTCETQTLPCWSPLRLQGPGGSLPTSFNTMHPIFQGHWGSEMLNNLPKFSQLVTVKIWGSNPNPSDSKDVSSCFIPRAVPVVEIIEPTQQPLLFLETVSGPPLNIR